MSFSFILAKRNYTFHIKNKQLKSGKRRKLQFHGAIWTSAGSYFTLQCFTSPAHWTTPTAFQTSSWGKRKRAVRPSRVSGRRRWSVGRQEETESHCRCQSPQIMRSKNPPNADFYQGSGLAQKVRVSIWEGCASAVQIFPRFPRLFQVSVGQPEFEFNEEGKASICQLDLIYPYHDKAALLCFPQS